jgi:hypothetical protein
MSDQWEMMWKKAGYIHFNEGYLLFQHLHGRNSKTTEDLNN